MKKSIALLLTLVLSAVMLGCPVYADCSLAYEGFIWNDSYDELTEEVNEYYRTNNIGDEMTKEKLSECEYGKLYILSEETSLADYTDGDINEFIKAHSESYFENFYFSENGHTDYFVRSSDGTVCFQNRTETDDSRPTVSLSNAVDILGRYDSLEAEVIFVRYVPLYVAIVSQNGVPKYAVVLTDGIYYPSEASADDTSGSAEIQNAFARLYDHGNGQHVFDFSFFRDYVKACNDELPDDLTYEPYGLQSEKHDKVSKIDGKAYYFDKDGICRGLYTGYAKRADGTRVYYKKGIALMELSGGNIENNL
ncbi:MAG: hypothetical protein ACI4J5_05220 [Oscillospiraceae bacterium]